LFDFNLVQSKLEFSNDGSGELVGGRETAEIPGSNPSFGQNLVDGIPQPAGVRLQPDEIQHLSRAQEHCGWVGHIFA